MAFLHHFYVSVIVLLYKEHTTATYFLYNGSILLFIEFMFYLTVILISIVTLFLSRKGENHTLHAHPKVSCMVTCYSEGAAIISTIDSLIKQSYQGDIEILIIVDSAKANASTHHVAKHYQKTHTLPANRTLKIIPKYRRMGVVSSNNLGLKLASGELLVRIDGDTSCEASSIENVVREMTSEPDVIALSGSVIPRNSHVNILTRMQDLEYKICIHLSRIGLSALGCLNIISGAFGGFNTRVLNKLGGWRNGSSEDLDLTLRLHALKSRYPSYRIKHAERAISYTDVPESWKILFKQRMRWDGDLVYIYFKRGRKFLRPKFFGWRNFTVISIVGLLFSIGLTLMLPVYLLVMYFTLGGLYLLTIMFAFYLYYTVVSLVFFIIYLLLLSEDRTFDLRSCLYIFLFPLYCFIMRLICCFAIVSELIFSTHKDSSLAPQHILKKVD